MSSNQVEETTLPQSENGIYSLQTRIKGHKGIVLCMALSEDGKLASGGFDGSRVWGIQDLFQRDVSTKRRPTHQLMRPSGAGDRGATTALCWIRREDEPEDGLIFGTARGLVVCWKEAATSNTTCYEETYCVQLANPSEITALCFDSTSNRLVVSNRNSVVQLLRVGSKLDLHPIFTVSISNHIPKAIAFGQRGEDRDIHTFGLHDGQIHTLNGRDGKVIHTHQTGCKIGNAVSNIKRGVFCIDDPNEGVALYRFDSWERIRVYPVQSKRSVMRPRQVSFVEDCKYILSTSDHGTVYLFDRRSGKMVDCLKNDEHNKVQALTASEHLEIPLIVSAVSCGGDDSSIINVWRKNVQTSMQNPQKTVQAVQPPPQSPSTTAMSVIQALSFICILVMAGAFVWQNRHVVVHF